jgi:cell division protein FtsI (penicillin-binding protein 3)
MFDNNFKNTNLKPTNTSIVSKLCLLVILAFLVLTIRCLQFFRYEHYQSISTQQNQKRVTETPQRGSILDRRGRVLAASNKIQNIFAEPRIIKDYKQFSNDLQPILDMGAHEICGLLLDSKNSGYVKIKTNATDAECSKAAGIYGAGIQSDFQRYYPTGPAASHIVGFTSTDNKGLVGIELYYDKKLAGSAGQNIFLADVRRRPILFKKQINNLTNGVGLILTIDTTIQQYARTELLKQMENYQAKSAIAIVAEPKTGEILAMVSLPDFDPQQIQSTDANNLRNRNLTDFYEPGSIIKPIIASIALDNNVVNTEEKIFCENGSYSGKGFGRIGEYRTGFGDLTIREIIAHSSNIGMAKIGQRLGAEKLYDGLTRFGFGVKTGIDLPGEVEGFLRKPNQWTGYSVTRIPFGQEICVTAIQLMRAYCILANGGNTVRPHVVKAIVDTDGNIVELKKPPPPVGFVVNLQIADWFVKEALVAVVNEGTGTRAKLEKWQVFGKSGTANIASSKNKGYSEKNYIASFIAGAPAEQPQLLVLVSIFRPNVALGKGYTGGTVAAPVAATILQKSLNYLQTTTN